MSSKGGFGDQVYFTDILSGTRNDTTVLVRTPFGKNTQENVHGEDIPGFVWDLNDNGRLVEHFSLRCRYRMEHG
jgi:hypothetical protein